MTDRERLEKIQERVMAEENSYARMMKENVLEKLIASTYKEGKLSCQIIIPLFEHDCNFLEETLAELGYSPKYSKEWNYYYETTCVRAVL